MKIEKNCAYVGWMWNYILTFMCVLWMYKCTLSHTWHEVTANCDLHVKCFVCRQIEQIMKPFGTKADLIIRRRRRKQLSYIVIKQVMLHTVYRRVFCLPLHKFPSYLASLHLVRNFRSLNSYFVSVKSLMDNLWHNINMYMITLQLCAVGLNTRAHISHGFICFCSYQLFYYNYRPFYFYFWCSSYFF